MGWARSSSFAKLEDLRYVIKVKHKFVMLSKSNITDT